jgi:hypothetical protein
MVNRIGLITSIRSTANVFREYLTGILIGWLKSLPEVTLPVWAVKIREIIAEELCRNISGSNDQPIDLLLEFDCKLWKEARITLRGLYVNTLIVGGEETKRNLGKPF